MTGWSGWLWLSITRERNELSDPKLAKFLQTRTPVCDSDRPPRRCRPSTRRCSPDHDCREISHARAAPRWWHRHIPAVSAQQRSGQPRYAKCGQPWRTLEEAAGGKGLKPAGLRQSLEKSEAAVVRGTHANPPGHVWSGALTGASSRRDVAGLPVAKRPAGRRWPRQPFTISLRAMNPQGFDARSGCRCLAG